MSVRQQPSESVVEIRDAFCTYPLPATSRSADATAVVALRGLSLRVEAGERVVVHGPNGAGKSTLMRLLAGEQTLAAGIAYVAGRRVGVRGAVAPTRLGWVDQRARSMVRPEFDVLGNLTLQQRISGVDAADARERATDLAGRLGISHLLSRRVQGLSGGEAQRVAVCAAVAHSPALVLADEPTGELDLAAARDVYAMLGAAVREVGAALVLVSHDPRAGTIADRVIRIRDGRLSESWTPSAPSSAGPAPTEWGAVRENLVVDERGWVRLPEHLRHHLGLGAQVYPEADSSGALRLIPAGPPKPTPLKAEARRAAPVGAASLGAAEPIVALREVTISYGDRSVVEGLTLALAPGQVTVLAGRSGSGKSSLLRVLAGLQPPSAGDVLWQGSSIIGWDRARLARSRRTLMAIADQDVVVPDGLDVTTMIDTARVARSLPPVSDGDLTQLLTELGVVHLATRRLTALSGGERQRAAVARVVLTGAQLLILDEPTSQLDETGADAVSEVLTRAAASGAAVLIATHDERLVEIADRVHDLSPHGASTVHSAAASKAKGHFT